MTSVGMAHLRFLLVENDASARGAGPAVRPIATGRARDAVLAIRAARAAPAGVARRDINGLRSGLTHQPLRLSALTPPEAKGQSRRKRDPSEDGKELLHGFSCLI